MGEITHCYEKELQKDPKLQGKVIVKFVIAPDGSVSTATTVRSILDDPAGYLDNPAVEDCVKKIVLAILFPEAKERSSWFRAEDVVVKYPFVFSPNE